VAKENKGLFGWADDLLNKHVEKTTEKYIEKYAKNSDGSVNESLAKRIEWEVGRRGETGKQLDIWEPIRWAGQQTGLNIILGAAIKLFTDKKISAPVLKLLAVTTTLTNAIQFVRIIPRYNAGMFGGLNTAIKMEKLQESSQVNVKTSSMPAIEELPDEKTPSNRIGKYTIPKPTSLMEQATREETGFSQRM
jgi:hypothetical protein